MDITRERLRELLVPGGRVKILAHWYKVTSREGDTVALEDQETHKRMTCGLDLIWHNEGLWAVLGPDSEELREGRK